MNEFSHKWAAELSDLKALLLNDLLILFYEDSIVCVLALVNGINKILTLTHRVKG